MLMTNYHTHTVRCGHAKNTDEEYVQKAIAQGYDIFGFADHTPWPYADGFVSSMRMRADELDEYLGSARGLKKKYADQIDVKIGLECEYFPLYLPWLEKTIKEKHINYVILGNHHDLTDQGGFYFGASSKPEHIRKYTLRTVAGMKTGMFSYLAHPDVVMRGYEEFDSACEDMAHAICQTAREMDMPLEYNVMGTFYKKMSTSWKGVGYPDDHFWKIAAHYGCKAIIGLDAHETRYVVSRDEYRQAADYLSGLGIERLETIPLRYDD